MVNNTEGLLFHNVSDGTISDVTMSANLNGIRVTGGENVVVEASEPIDNTRSGIVSTSGNAGLTNLTVRNNDVTGNRRYGIDLQATSTIVENNTVTGNDNGLDVTGTNSISILSNNVSANDAQGIRASGDNVTIRNNTVTENAADGGEGIQVGFHRGSDSSVVWNNVSLNSDTGILVESGGGLIANNTLVNNDEAGVHVRADGSVLRDNTARNNRWGIRLYNYDSGLFDPYLEVERTLVTENVVTGND